MIQVQFMKPFYTKVNGKNLRLVFAYQYFSIVKDDELYHFVPVEGKEMIVNLETKQIENMSEIFVFQRGNRFIRMPLYQLLLISNVHEHLSPILEKASTKEETVNLLPKDEEESEVKKMIRHLEELNLDRLIDEALEKRDEKRFYDLLDEKAKLHWT
ncbi:MULTISPECIES: IDEAL domain-containing protein [Lysinibacillus]|uniref:IDEAL domain-containing protein n=1 Tax=Lysinibacillus antri TaxID=2498145 RepID=A0A3S0PPW8_9BACI|nr:MULTISPECIES: IDEAL domain-containing protein [Lysinibacillus]RUL53197.1 IDEAL domain-containing protein [Lysinibacillus antri]TSI07403.1 IDEAL domain-containing protein [Lysinibacillus sp. BW-2-10]